MTYKKECPTCPLMKICSGILAQIQGNCIFLNGFKTIITNRDGDIIEFYDKKNELQKARLCPQKVTRIFLINN